jgi:hypothetical protein
MRARMAETMAGNVTMDEDESVGIYIERSELCPVGQTPALSMKVHMREHDTTPDDVSCSVCHETDVVHNTPCGHWVHPWCLEPWLSQSDKCPVCRAPLTILCTATWKHNGSSSEPAPAITLPQYLRRSSVVIRLDDHTAQVQMDDPDYQPDTTDDDDDSDDNDSADDDDSAEPSLSRMFQRICNEANEDDDDETDEPCVDSKNSFTVRASGRARVTINISSRAGQGNE